MNLEINHLYKFDQNYNHPVAGVDEVGRGCLAGPVVAAAVILNDFDNNEINDSKKIPKKKREELSSYIKQNSIYSIGEASVEEIDKLNILNASLLAMKRAIKNLSSQPESILVDGNFKPINETNVFSIVKGDTKSISIAAASIVAKVYRDKLMAEFSKTHPEYKFENNSGYGTKEHQKALLKFGISPIHRRSFKPIHYILNNKD